MGTAKPLVHRALQLAAWSPFRSDSPHHSEPKRVSSTSIEPACHGGSASRQLIWNCAVCRLATRWPPSAPGLHRQLIKAVITPILATLSCSSHASFTHPRAPRVHADFDLTVTVAISRNHRLFDTTASLHVEFHPPYIKSNRLLDLGPALLGRPLFPYLVALVLTGGCQLRAMAENHNIS